MTVLVDAHVLLWTIYKPAQLSRPVASIVEDLRNKLLVSETTQWELLNKVGRGKIAFAGSSVAAVAQRIRDLQVDFVPILQVDTVAAATLPHHHSDPSIACSLPSLDACKFPSSQEMASSPATEFR